jgi:carbamoyltransferase
VQIVREDVDPFCHADLRAMGRRIGAEVAVNTSLNVGAPIAQTPLQAIETLKKTRAMDGLFMIASDGTTLVAWHDIDAPPKDAGKRLREWICSWREMKHDAIASRAVLNR